MALTQTAPACRKLERQRSLRESPTVDNMCIKGSYILSSLPKRATRPRSTVVVSETGQVRSSFQTTAYHTHTAAVQRHLRTRPESPHPRRAGPRGLLVPGPDDVRIVGEGVVHGLHAVDRLPDARLTDLPPLQEERVGVWLNGQTSRRRLLQEPKPSE